MIRPAAGFEALGQRVGALVEPAVVSTGLVLEGVTIAPAGARRVVRVVVDLPDGAVGGVSLDDIAEVSRAIEAVLDADDTVLGSTPYVLEVGSPGTSRPLVDARHWARARTRLVRVTVAGTPLVGRVAAVDDQGVVLTVDGEDRRVPWSDLGTGRLELEFSRPGSDEGTDGDSDDDAGNADERS